MGISKRGDGYLRTLLIHGARAAVQQATQKRAARRRWSNSLRQRRGKTSTALAVAHKNARSLWALLVTGEPYRQAA